MLRIFSEPGASALDEDRPVFQELIHTAKRTGHPFDLVIVHWLSRFSRDSLHSELYIRELVEKGLMAAEDHSLRERLVNLRFWRDELTDQISDLTRRLVAAEPVITLAKVEHLALLLRDKLRRGRCSAKCA